jgi:hypothetical protein
MLAEAIRPTNCVERSASYALLSHSQTPRSTLQLVLIKSITTLYKVSQSIESREPDRHEITLEPL